MSAQISVADYFDPYNLDHVRAYQVLYKTGMWPRDFHISLPAHVVFPPGWQVGVMNKLADAWVNHVDESYSS